MVIFFLTIIFLKEIIIRNRLELSFETGGDGEEIFFF